MPREEAWIIAYQICEHCCRCLLKRKRSIGKRREGCSIAHEHCDPPALHGLAIAARLVLQPRSGLPAIYNHTVYHSCRDICRYSSLDERDHVRSGSKSPLPRALFIAGLDKDRLCCSQHAYGCMAVHTRNVADMQEPGNGNASHRTHPARCEMRGVEDMWAPGEPRKAKYFDRVIVTPLLVFIGTLLVIPLSWFRLVEAIGCIHATSCATIQRVGPWSSISLIVETDHDAAYRLYVANARKEISNTKDR